MPRIIDTMNGLGEGVWGKPQFHKLDIIAVEQYVEDLVLGAYFIPDGKMMTPYERGLIVAQSPAAQEILQAGNNHNLAERVFENTQAQLDDVTATLAKLVPIERINLIAKERAANLSVSLGSLTQKAEIHWAEVLDTNMALQPHFQAEHNRPGAPVAEGAGSE